jgi:hypothetical protein
MASIIKVSNKGTKFFGCSKERGKSEIRFDSGNGALSQVSWNWKIENDLCAFIAKSMDFSQ